MKKWRSLTHTPQGMEQISFSHNLYGDIRERRRRRGSSGSHWNQNGVLRGRDLEWDRRDPQGMQRQTRRHTNDSGISRGRDIQIDQRNAVERFDRRNMEVSVTGRLTTRLDAVEKAEFDASSVGQTIRYIRTGSDVKDKTSTPPISSVIRNDYSQNFINTDQRPQNYIRDTSIIDRFEEYPKLRELARLKDEMTQKRATPPHYLKADLRTFDLKKLGTQFDVILIDPPLPEYIWRSPSAVNHPQYVGDKQWSWEDIANLRIEDVGATPSFIFMWIGNTDGLEKGREILAKWGYRRCEDIVWIKTNRTWEGKRPMDDKSVLVHTKEHCLMGIKGTVRRSTDGHFIHCNVDTDVIIAEEPHLDSLEKPEELYYIIEHFCLGRRRLELFGQDNNIRPGWVTIGTGVSSSNFDAEQYASYFAQPAGHLVGSTPVIESLRPKSPPPNKRNPRQSGMQPSHMMPVQNMMMGPVQPMGVWY